MELAALLRVHSAQTALNSKNDTALNRLKTMVTKI
jgi:hypothetical protein